MFFPKPNKKIFCVLFIILILIIIIFINNTNDSPIANLSLDDDISDINNNLNPDYTINHYDSYDIVTFESNIPKTIFNDVSKVELYTNDSHVFLIKIYSSDSKETIQKIIKKKYGNYTLENSKDNYVLTMQKEIPDYYSYDLIFNKSNTYSINISGDNNITIIEFTFTD